MTVPPGFGYNSPGWDATGASWYLAEFAGALTANRTYTLQDSDMTLAALNLAQTFTANQIVQNDGAQGTFTVRNYGSFSPLIIMERANGSLASPTAVANGESVAGVNGRGWDGSAFQNLAVIAMQVDGVPSGSDIPGRIVLGVHRLGDTAGATVGRWQLANFGDVTQTPIHDTTNTVKTVRTSRLRITTGTIAAGFGQRTLYQLRSSTTNDQDAAAVDVIWGTATHATRTAYAAHYVTISGTLTELMRLSSSGVKTVGRQKAVVTKSADYTATGLDEVIAFTATGKTLTLPAATGSGQTYTVYAEPNTTVIIDGATTDTIDGQLTQTLDGPGSIILHDYASGKWCIG